VPEVGVGWTLPALLAGEKTCSRQTWGGGSGRGAGRLRAGSVVTVYAGRIRDSGSNGGTGGTGGTGSTGHTSSRTRRRAVAIIRLTEDPTLQSLNEIPDSDYAAEGWRWLHGHPEALRSPQVTFDDFSWEAFERWRHRSGQCWVLRFEVLQLLRPAGTVRRVLVVDDDTAIRSVIASTLRHEGYDVETAKNGKEALARLRTYRPNLILLDYEMPVCDGPTFAAAYREAEPLRAPIILVTAAADPADRAAAVEASDVLPKPFDVEELVSLVSRHAGGKESHGANYH
jgi:CheY-like chemotaxis protein